MMAMIEKKCPVCGQVLPASNFWKDKRNKVDGLQYKCKECQRKHFKENRSHINAYKCEWTHRTGRNKSIAESKDSGVWLGTHITEEAIAELLGDAKKMPLKHEGWDLESKNYGKIDVKAACIFLYKGKNISWLFHINRNQLPDYFACVAFDSRESLTPLHMWLIPAKEINHLVSLTIYESGTSLKRWKGYEKPIEGLKEICKNHREKATA